MARDVEIRVYNFSSQQMLLTNRDCRMRRHFYWQTSTDWERMELNRFKGPTLESFPNRPLNLGNRRYPQSRHLTPFFDKEYVGFDELVVDMLRHGYFITDYRQLKGVLRDYNDVLPLIDRGYVIEDFNGQVILVKREQGQLHSEVWVVDADLLWRINKCKLVRKERSARHGIGDRLVYVQGENRLNTLSERQRAMLDDCQEKILKEVQGAEVGKACVDEPVCVPLALPDEGPRRYLNARPLPGRIEAPAFKRPPKAEPMSKDTILGYDDLGGSITFKDVLAEGRRTPPKGLPPDLMPDAPEECSDDQWERLMLIEQIKFRRRCGL